MAKYYNTDSERCDPGLYTKGVVIGVYDTSYMRATGFEKIIRETRRMTGHQCDWHYFAGRADVKVYEGDEEIIKSILNPLFEKAYNELGPKWCEAADMTWQEGRKGYLEYTRGEPTV